MKALSDSDQGSPFVAEGLSHPEPMFVHVPMIVSELLSQLGVDRPGA